MQEPGQQPPPLKGSAEQVQELLDGLISNGYQVEAAVRLIARHVDRLREFVVEREIKSIRNRGLEKDSYWRSMLEEELGIATLAAPILDDTPPLL